MGAKDKITTERILRFLQELNSYNVHTSADHDLPEKLVNEMHTLEEHFKMIEACEKANCASIEDGLNIHIVSNNEVEYCDCVNPNLGKSVLRCGKCDKRFKPL